MKPIRTQEDREATLHEIGTIFDARAGRPEADRLEGLTTLVEAHEREHCPIPPPIPWARSSTMLRVAGHLNRTLCRESARGSAWTMSSDAAMRSRSA